MAGRDQGIDPKGATELGSEAEPGSALTVTDPAGAAAQSRGPKRGLVGRKLAHFLLEERIGRGGMGEVYRATDVALDRPVAIKVLAEEIAGDPQLRERFYREARAQARIQHPNVCHIYYIGEEEGLLFFAMEFIEGESLHERLKRDGKLAPGEAIELCRMAALGLREAHRHGFTHRDVKPSNLMVDRHGAVKVLDFGIVKKATAAEGADTAITRERGALIGTPLYMAPEQARGDEVDRRADIYALGATLHHLIAGAPPHGGDTPMAVVSRHLADPRPRLPRGKRRGESAALDQLLDRMMAKRPEDRFADYDDLLAALESLSPARSRPAGLWARGFAIAIDLLVATLLAVPLDLLVPDPLSKIAFAGAALAYSVFAHARFGRTVGKALLELRVIPVDEGGPPGLRRSAVRFLTEWGPLYFTWGLAAAIDVTLGDGGWLGAAQAVIALSGLLYLLLFALRATTDVYKRALWDLVSRTRVVYAR